MTLAEIAARTNAWCEARGIRPANGQAARALSERTLRYYRALGLIDPPERGGGEGYGQRHLNQLIAIRILQGQGLPLGRVQALLYGRSDAELRAVAARAGSIGARDARVSIDPPGGRVGEPRPCPSYALGDGYMLVCANGRSVAPGALRSIAEILAGRGAAPVAGADRTESSTRRRTARR